MGKVRIINDERITKEIQDHCRNYFNSLPKEVIKSYLNKILK